ncbi:MAG: DUF84 family protein [Calditrichaceae bacterium]|nr:DUF84 family protein [Calditrichaceae bacterium]MBN2709132.1 DUF84 family protein [Calditrichaceae bacterium]RQV96088.1 MAG: DUF84 family protein [Calditrichota bacterium]
MLVGIGTENKIKTTACINAIKQVWKQNDRLETDIGFSTISPKISVPEMPLTLEEIREGACQRALYTYDNLENCTIGMGMEGGVFLFEHSGKSDAYLQNWVYAYDGRYGYFGSSPALTLPVFLKHALYDEKRELSEVIDEFSGKSDVRSNEGAFGILTKNLITRYDSFVSAVICAMTPLVSKAIYSKGRLR